MESDTSPTLPRNMTPRGDVAEGADSKNLVKMVIRRVFATIRDEGFRVGDSLPAEASFAERFGVSRQVIREAFGALSTLGILDVGNGRRPRVAAFKPDGLILSMQHALNTRQINAAQVWEVRHVIERKSAGEAAKLRTREEAYELVGIANRMAYAPPGSPEIISLDIRFHQHIAASSHNLLLQHVIASFEPLMWQVVPVTWRTRITDEERQEVVDVHRDIARAIANQDEEAARQSIDRHFFADIMTRLRAFDGEQDHAPDR